MTFVKQLLRVISLFSRATSLNFFFSFADGFTSHLFDKRDFITFRLYFYSCLKTLLTAFFLLRLLNGLLFIELSRLRLKLALFVPWGLATFFHHLFKSNTMQHVSPIINSQRQPNLEKSEKTSRTFNRK